MSDTVCPLCSSNALFLFNRDQQRDYYRCEECYLVFVPIDQHLSAIEEKAIYDLHENHLDDPDYRQFLSRLTTPLLPRLLPTSVGLDYGCGPGPMLAQMLSEQGLRIDLFDPFYVNNPQVLNRRYDFVTCTEVVEHFRQPGKEFKKLFALLKSKGVLALMTKLVINADAFSRWHYKNDMTHICFYSNQTLHWLARTHQCDLNILGKDVIIFQRQT